MKDCSVVTATYDLGEGVKGTIGIVGPKRMDYENVVDNLKNLKSQLDGILIKKKGNPRKVVNMAENKKVMEEEAVDTKETKAEQTCEETKDTKETAAEETKETAAEERIQRKKRNPKKGCLWKEKER